MSPPLFHHLTLKASRSQHLTAGGCAAAGWVLFIVTKCVQGFGQAALTEGLSCFTGTDDICSPSVFPTKISCLGHDVSLDAHCELSGLAGEPTGVGNAQFFFKAANSLLSVTC